MNNQMPAQADPVMDRGDDPVMDRGDWNTYTSPDSRHKIVDKILDNLKRRVPVSGPEELHELRKVAERFEHRIFSATGSQSDYLRKISLKMLELEKKKFKASTNSLPSNSASHSKESHRSRL